MLYRKKFYILKDRQKNTAGHLKFEINGGIMRVEVFPTMPFFGQRLKLFSWSEKERSRPFFIADIKNKNVFSVYKNNENDIENTDTFFICNNDKIVYYASEKDDFMVCDWVFNQPALEDDLGYFFVENKNISDIDKRLVNPELISMVKYYGYFIRGENRKNRMLTAVGIPAYYDVDPHPFYKYRLLSIWEPEQRGKTAYGDFGYWIIGINEKSNDFYKVCG